MPRDGPPAGALSNKNIENSARATAQRSRSPKLPNGISEIPDAIEARQIDGEIYRRKEREREIGVGIEREAE